MAELTGAANVLGVERIELGWGKATDGRYVVFVRPVSISAKKPLGEFALTESEAGDLQFRLAALLEEMAKQPH